MRPPIDTRPPYGLMVWAVISLIASLAFYAAPLRIAGGPDLMPMLPLIALFIWSTVRPRFIPPIVIFIIGLLQDVLSGGVMGVWALAYLASMTITRNRDEDGPTREIGPVWVAFPCDAGRSPFRLPGQPAVLAIGQMAPMRPLLIESVASGLMFPLIALMFPSAGAACAALSGRDEMKSDRQEQQLKFTRRALMMGGGGALVFTALAVRLHQLQVVETERYRLLSEDNQFNFLLTPPSRGRILDRFGTPVADNRDSYRVVMIPEQAGDAEAALDRLGRQLIEITPEQRERILRNIRRLAGFPSGHGPR